MHVRVKKNGIVLAEGTVDRMSKFQTEKETSNNKVIESKVIKNGEVIAESTNERYKQVRNNFKNKNDNRNNNKGYQEKKYPTAQQKAREVEKEKNDIKKTINKNINSQNKKGQRTSRSVGFNNKYGATTENIVAVKEEIVPTIKDVTNRPVEEVLEEVKGMVEETVSIKVTSDINGEEKVTIQGIATEQMVSYEEVEVNEDFEASEEHIKNNF